MSDNNPHESAQREALPLPNVEKYIPTEGEHGSRAFPEQPEGHRAYVARAKAPNVLAKPLGGYLPDVSLNGCNKGSFDAAMFQRARRSR